MLFSLKDLASKLSPTPNESLHCIKTNNFTLHHFQTLSGLMFVLNTDPDMPGNKTIIPIYLINIKLYFL
jgi:hypothetical protein